MEFPEITNNLVIRCDTEIKAKLLLSIAEEQNIHWLGGEKATNKTPYFGKNTCYCFARFDSGFGPFFVRYGDFEFFNTFKAPVIEFDEFLFGPKDSIESPDRSGLIQDSYTSVYVIEQNSGSSTKTIGVYASKEQAKKKKEVLERVNRDLIKDGKAQYEVSEQSLQSILTQDSKNYEEPER